MCTIYQFLLIVTVPRQLVPTQISRNLTSFQVISNLIILNSYFCMLKNLQLIYIDHLTLLSVKITLQICIENTKTKPTYKSKQLK